MNHERMDEYFQYAATAKTIGIDVNFLTPDEVKAIWPLCETDNLVGAILHPEDGYIQPADLTQAMAKGARARGATIYRNTAVLSLNKVLKVAGRLRPIKGPSLVTMWYRLLETMHVKLVPWSV